MKVPLSRIAHTRSGDKGDACNIGVIAFDEAHYPILLREVTAELVKRHFGRLVKGEVERYELPNLGALNFILHQALGGGGTVSLRTDAQGKFQVSVRNVDAADGMVEQLDADDPTVQVTLRVQDASGHEQRFSLRLPRPLHGSEYRVRLKKKESCKEGVEHS